MIPQDLNKRKELNKYVDSAYNLHLELETLKEDLKEIKLQVSDTIGKDYAKSFDLLVKARLEESKLSEDAEKKLEAIEETKILKAS